MWLCAARCISSECLERCAAPCAGAVRALRRCQRTARCAPDDAQCQQQACRAQCEPVFSALPIAPAGRIPEACPEQGPPAPGLPPELVGRWELVAASIVREAHEDEDMVVRADYGLRLRISPQGCFALETQLKASTLGAGNRLTFRVWGRVVMRGEREWVAQGEGGKVYGAACTEPRALELAGAALRTVAHVTFAVDGDTLSLAPVRSPSNALVFERVEP